MEFGIYQAKRLVRAPVIWYGRRRFADEPPDVRLRLEHNAYRRRVRQAWDKAGIDPLHLYRADLDATSIAVDAGAFDGQVAQIMHRLYGCQVYAFEPSPAFFAQIQDRVADVPAITAIECGLGGSDGTLPLSIEGQGSTVFGSSEGDADTVDVQIRDVDDALSDLGHERIDFLKLNIEGGEYDVLDRLFDTGWNPRIRYFLIQFHEWIPGAERRRWRIRRRLRATHEQVWNYPWSYELWCAKDRPHPPPPRFSRSEMATIRRQLAERRAEAAPAAGGDAAPPSA